jgi:hypothetical protein
MLLNPSGKISLFAYSGANHEIQLAKIMYWTCTSLVKSCETIPGISDHDMLVIDSDLKPTYNKPKCRKVYIYKGVDMNAIKQNMTELSENIINTDVDSPMHNM